MDIDCSGTTPSLTITEETPKSPNIKGKKNSGEFFLNIIYFYLGTKNIE